MKEKIKHLLKNMRFKDWKYAISVIFVSVLAFFMHKWFQKSFAGNISAVVAVINVFINIFLISRISSSLEKLKKERPVQYQYLPERYRNVPDMNGWIALTLVLLIIFVCLSWTDSIFVLIAYWVLYYSYMEAAVRREIGSTLTMQKDKLLKIYSELKRDEQISDLQNLIEKGFKDADNRTNVIRAFSEFFFMHIQTVFGGFEDWPDKLEDTYLSIYDKTYTYIRDIFEGVERIDVCIFLADFIIDIDEILKAGLEKKQYIYRTILAAIISYAVFEKGKVNQNSLFQHLGAELSEDKIEIINILFLYFEFAFQYNDKKDRKKIRLNEAITRIYNHKMELNSENVVFYLYLWYVWVRKMNYSLSESILNLKGLINYCNGEKEQRANEIHSSKSLYILIKSNQMEQEMTL